jgi:DNA ligase 1
MAVSFLELCNTFEEISKTTKRLEIQSILSGFLSHVIKKDPESLYHILYLCTATVFPQYHNIELGIGDFAILNLVSESTGLNVKTIKEKFIKTGDLGTIAMENRVKQLFISTKTLSAQDVLTNLRKITKEVGKNSSTSKRNIMLSMINCSSPLETKYLIRLFECKLKIGLALQTVLISLSLAFGESDYEIIKTAYNKQCDFENLARLLLQHGIEGLEKNSKIVPGIPLKPMLAQPSKNLTKAFSKVEKNSFISEYKYDGERVQIHYNNGKTTVFSRNSEDISEKYPDICNLQIQGPLLPDQTVLNTKSAGDGLKNYVASSNSGVEIISKEDNIAKNEINTEDVSNKYTKESKDVFITSFIIDGEAVAYDNKEILPFQILSTRKRKKIEKIEVKVCVFAFDILYFNGQELLNHTLKERREILYGHFKEIEDRFYFTNSMECKDVEDIDSHFKAAIQNNCEGVMLKSLESNYMPSQRTNSWVKMKKDYLDSLGDSMDLVVMGAFYGKGKRTGTYGGFLLGVYNDEKDKYEVCCKIGTGFSDENLVDFHEKLSSIVTCNTSEYIFDDKIKPDVWVLPKYVWEVKAASLSLSPVYSAGANGDKGISLRFPRFIRERSDKSSKDSTTANQLISMYNEDINQESEEDEFN